MENAKTRGGVHVQTTVSANAHSQDELRLMKTQDAKYLSLKATADTRKAERLRGQLHLLGVPAKGRKHVVFVDDEREAAEFDPEKHFDTPAELLDRTFNRPRRAQLADPGAVKGAAAANKAARQAMAAYKELRQREERGRKLGALAAQQVADREGMTKGRKRKLQLEETGSAKKVFKWKAERKR
jgi:U3 small nucleolar RNA-associated protein 11